MKVFLRYIRAIKNAQSQAVQYIYSGRGSSCNIVEQLAARASDTGKKHQTYVDMRNLKDLSESSGQCKTKIGSHGFLPPHFLRWPPSNMETFNLEKASIAQNSQIWQPNTELRLLGPSWWNFEVWVWKEKNWVKVRSRQRRIESLFMIMYKRDFWLIHFSTNWKFWFGTKQCRFLDEAH